MTQGAGGQHAAPESSTDPSAPAHLATGLSVCGCPLPPLPLRPARDSAATAATPGPAAAAEPAATHTPQPPAAFGCPWRPARPCASGQPPRKFRVWLPPPRSPEGTPRRPRYSARTHEWDPIASRGSGRGPRPPHPAAPLPAAGSRSRSRAESSPRFASARERSGRRGRWLPALARSLAHAMLGQRGSGRRVFTHIRVREERRKKKKKKVSFKPEQKTFNMKSHSRNRHRP